MKTFKADFHIHSCLSPCGSLEMSPDVIVQRGMEEGLQILALTDHNTTLNCPAFVYHCKEAGIFPLCGTEITTAEEAHVLGLFKDDRTALAFGEELSGSLLKVPNNPEKLGDQIVVNHLNEITGEVDYYLGAASLWSLDETVEKIRSYEGIFIPSHIDRPMFSLTSQLGFVPPMEYDGLEIALPDTDISAYPYPLLANSDAHYPNGIGKKYNEITLDELSFEAVKRAIKKGEITRRYNL